MTLPTAAYQFAPFAPDPANILAGLATANAGTIITIPAGRIWSGMVTITGSILVAPASVNAISASARVSTSGTGVIPAAGDYVRLDLASAGSALSSVGTGANSSISAPLIVAAPSGNSVTLVLNVTNTNTQSASASGILL